MPLDWDEFRFVKAVADGGGLAAAAQELGINHSTAFRRLGALEAQLDARLFERLRTGYVPTPAGRAMLAAAVRIETDVTQFARTVAGQGETPTGELRLTAPTGFATSLLMPILADFCIRYPAIRIDLILAEEALNLSRRDADVAIRVSRDPRGTLVGRRLAAVAWAVALLVWRYGRIEERWSADLAPSPNSG